MDTNGSDDRISNWTIATRTEPGRRKPVADEERRNHARHGTPTVQVLRAAPKTVAVIGGQSDWSWLKALPDTAECDVILVAPFAHAYSRIKWSHPDLIVARLEMDDPEGCLVLSMLKADRSTRDIPMALWRQEELPAADSSMALRFCC